MAKVYSYEHLSVVYATDYVWSNMAKTPELESQMSWHELYESMAYVMGVNCELEEGETHEYTHEQKAYLVQDTLDNEVGIPCTSEELFNNNDLGRIQEMFGTLMNLNIFLYMDKLKRGDNTFKGLTFKLEIK